MSDTLIEFLWARLRVIFESLIDVITSIDSNLIHNVGRSSNDAFLLRAYLTFMKNRYGDEISITVDVINRDGQFYIESDVCNDEGIILAEGPSITVAALTENSLITWLTNFETFINNNQGLLHSRISEL